MAPPWPEPARHPDEEAIVAVAMATAAPDGVPARPMNRVDAWWNRHFPPFSTRRLVFGLAALPVIGALQELVWMAMGRDPSLPRYLFVCIAGGGLLATAWLPGMREMAERLAAAKGTSPWPWPGKNTPAPQTPPSPIERNFRRDFFVALPFSLVIMLVISLAVMGPADVFTPAVLLMNAVAAAFTAALLAIRTSVWALALFSIVGGLLGGFAFVLLSVMTFSDPGGVDFLLGWAIGSAMLFLFAYPMWKGARDLEARGFRLPMWILMGGSVILVSGAALMFAAER